MWEQTTSVSSLKSSISPTSLSSFATAVTLLPLLLQHLILGAVGHVITPAARLPAPLPSAVYGNSIGAEDLLLEGQPLNWLGKRAVQTCDGSGIFLCPQGDCYTGRDGFIGCCTKETCRARTTCLEYDEVDESSCDPDEGGCVRCINVAAPACVTLTNIQENQYALYCDTERTIKTYSFENKVTSGSTALFPGEDDGSSTSTSTTTVASTGETRTVASTSETSSDESEGDDDGNGSSSDSLSGGEIAGIAIGSAIATAVVFSLMFWFFLRGGATSRPNWMSKKSFKQEDQQGAAGATPLFAGHDGSPTDTPYGLGLNEFEGSTPEVKQHPWAPDSMAFYKPKPIAPYIESPELDGSPRSINEIDSDNSNTISALPKGLRPQSENTVSALGSASISAQTPATPSFRDSTISRDTGKPVTRAQSQELSFPRSLEISKPSIDGIAASASNSSTKEDIDRQDTSAGASATLRKSTAHIVQPDTPPMEQEEHKNARYLSAEMALNGGYWGEKKKKENSGSDGGEVRAKYNEIAESGIVEEDGQAEPK